MAARSERAILEKGRGIDSSRRVPDFRRPVDVCRRHRGCDAGSDVPSAPHPPVGHLARDAEEVAVVSGLVGDLVDAGTANGGST